MPGHARWITSIPAGGLRAAACLMSGAAPFDPALAAPALAAEARGLEDDLAAVGLEPVDFLDHAIPLCVRFHSPLELADIALRKIKGPQLTDAAARRLARRLRSLWAALEEAKPDVLEELELASQPLRDAWDARGPGLLATVARLAEADFVVDAADVILVPAAAGGGSAHPLYNAISFEIVPLREDADLPEFLRLSWLWAQLNLDLPKYHDALGRAAMARVGPLAVLPVVLAAAAELEVVAFDRPLVDRALATWSAPAVDADALCRWWETYREGSAAWPVALAALGQMISP
jgi:hypothetical protein